MAKTADVHDPDYRAELEAAEKQLDEGDYDESVRRSVELYQRLLVARPDLVIIRGPAELSAVKGRPERPRFAPWPNTLGVVLDFDDDHHPVMRFEKDSFVMSEAATYFEYALEAAVRAQEPPA